MSVRTEVRGQYASKSNSRQSRWGGRGGAGLGRRIRTGRKLGQIIHPAVRLETIEMQC